ncbi:hypothetical protein DDN60_15485 [Vibrio cholerae]|nr:hypothetical protein [Vibrio cholerae]
MGFDPEFLIQVFLRGGIMSNCCNLALTRFIVATAMGFCGEQHGEDFARRLIIDAGISLENEEDAKVIDELGDEFRDMVKRFTSNV